MNGTAPLREIRERHDLSADHPEIVEELTALMAKYRKTGRSRGAQ